MIIDNKGILFFIARSLYMSNRVKDKLPEKEINSIITELSEQFCIETDSIHWNSQLKILTFYETIDSGDPEITCTRLWTLDTATGELTTTGHIDCYIQIGTDMYSIIWL